MTRMNPKKKLASNNSNNFHKDYTFKCDMVLSKHYTHFSSTSIIKQQLPNRFPCIFHIFTRNVVIMFMFLLQQAPVIKHSFFQGCVQTVTVVKCMSLTIVTQSKEPKWNIHSHSFDKQAKVYKQCKIIHFRFRFVCFIFRMSKQLHITHWSFYARIKNIIVNTCFFLFAYIRYDICMFETVNEYSCLFVSYFF